jgi:hypothetical protein
MESRWGHEMIANVFLRWRSLLWMAPTFVVLWLSAIQLHLEAVSPSLDSSWLGALSYFAARHLQYGTDVIFTYGPLAYLGTGVYSGFLFRERVIWELVFKAINAGFLCWVIARLPRIWSPLYLGYCLLFVLPGFPEALYFFSVTILVAFLLRSGAVTIHLADILAIILLSVVSLMKYNYLALVLLGIVAATATAFSKRNLGRAAWISGSFLTSFLLSWRWAGQDLGHLGSYLRAGIEVSLGYKEAMGAPASNNLVEPLGLLCLGLVFVQLIYLIIKRRELSVLLTALFLGSDMALGWNHGFVRADQHVVTFFGPCPAALLTFWATGVTNRLSRWPLYSTAIVNMSLCLAGLFVQDSALVTACVGRAANQIRLGWNLVFHESRIERELERDLVEQKMVSALPRVKAEVGQATIDMLGYEQGALLLNGLNYTPRPVFQGYTAYTKSLIEQNREFYRSGRAPSYALVKYQTIDNRYPALDDAAVFKELLYHYVFLFSEKDYSLWKKRSRSREPQAGDLGRGVTTFGTEVAVPQTGIVWLELQIRKSILGKVAALLYKPPLLEIAVTSTDGSAVRYRLISPMAANGFIINPMLLTGHDLIGAARGAQSKVTKSFAVWISPGDQKFFRATIQYRTTLLPLVPSPQATTSQSSTITAPRK